MTRKRFCILGVVSIATAFLIAACGGSSTPSPTPTPSPIPSVMPTPAASPEPDLLIRPVCISTEAYSLEHLVAVINQDAVSTGFDAINSGTCQFQIPINQIKVELTGENGSQTVVISLAAPATDLRFPLPSTLDVPLIDPTLPPGRYERTVTVAPALSSGPTAVIPGFEPVLLVRDPGSTTAQLLDSLFELWERSENV